MPEPCEYTRHRCMEQPARNALLVARADLGFIFRPQTALRQQQAPQTAQIVQDAPAAGDVKVKPGEVVGNQEETFFAAVLGLDAQLLLGVLALLDATQLVLTLGDRRLLGIEPP